jgi:hypothetical protein
MSFIFHNGFTEAMRLDSSGNLGIGASSPILVPIEMTQIRNTKFTNVDTEVLRNLWLAKFGGRAASLQDLKGLDGDDIIEIGQELANRKQIRFETQGYVDRTEIKHFYVLEKDNADH